MIARRANKDRTCHRCGSSIVSGTVYYTIRERAVSHNEAMHAGTYYPERKVCVECAEKQRAAVAAAIASQSAE
jgi:hypothetical protein